MIKFSIGSKQFHIFRRFISNMAPRFSIFVDSHVLMFNMIFVHGWLLNNCGLPFNPWYCVFHWFVTRELII